MPEENLKIPIKFTPKQADLFQRLSTQEKLVIYFEQELGKLLNSKSLNVFQRNTINTFKKDKILKDIMLIEGNMNLHFEFSKPSDYKVVTDWLEATITRVDNKIKPIKRQHQLATEKRDRIRKEFEVTLEEENKNVNKEKLRMGQKTE